MLNKDLVDLSYDYACEFFAKATKDNATLDFKKICKGVKKLAKFSDEEFDQIIGSFYVDLLQDNRFVFLGNDKWTLKDNISLDVYNKNQNSLYKYNTDNMSVQEDYDEEALPKDMLNEDNEVYEENEQEVSRDSFDDESSDLKYNFDDEENDDDIMNQEEEIDNDK